MKKNLYFGVLLCLASATVFGFVPSILKFMIMGGVSQSACVIIPNIVSILFWGILCIVKHEKLFPGSRTALLLIIAGALGLGVTPLCLISAYKLIPIGTAIVLHFFYPTLVTMLCILFFHKKLTPQIACAAVLSLAGVSFMSLEGEAFLQGNFMGYTYALLSGAAYAVFIIGSDKIESSTRIALIYTNVGSVFVGLILIACGQSWNPPRSLLYWAVSIGHGFVELIGFFLLTVGVRYAGAVTASFGTLMEPLTAVVMGIVLYGEPLHKSNIAGVIMVLSAVWLNVAAFPVSGMSKVMVWLIMLNESAGKRIGYNARFSQEFNPKTSSLPVMRKKARLLTYR